MAPLPPVALNSEPEAQATLHLPAGATVTTPDQGTAAGIKPHRCVVDLVGGVVEADHDFRSDLRPGRQSHLPEEQRRQTGVEADAEQAQQGSGAIAAKSSNPAELALQVEVMAMGEGSDADFPAIYADLFGKHTLDNSDGGWSYEVFNSFADLPDFLG